MDLKSSDQKSSDQKSSEWIRHTKPALILAPMEGVTDYPMRRFVTEKMPFQFCVSEFLRISHELLSDRVIIRHVPELKSAGKTLSGTPVQVQLLGGDPGRLAKTAVQAVSLGAKSIDINFGCPAPTVNRHDGGATLLKYPQRIYAILSEIRSALPKHIPLSAKFRLGWENPADILENAVQANKAGVDWITIHARTRMQGYAPPVQWGWIKLAKAEVDIPVVANGDIWDFEQFLNCREQTGCEHFMLGRGALANPTLAFSMAQALGISHSYSPISFQNMARDWVPLIERFREFSLDFHLDPKGREGYLPKRIKQWINMATRCGEFPWFDELKRMDSVDEMIIFLREN